MDGSRLTLEAICSGLRITQTRCEKHDEDFDIVFAEGEYGKGQHRIEVSFCRLLSEAVELLKEQSKTIEELEDELHRTENMLNHYLNGNE